jgi:salicylate hydroxylase
MARASRILIAGAGIGGLTAALALLKRGFDVDVYEQAHELKEVGAGVQLSANGNRVLHELGLLETLKTLACNASGKEIRLWSTGQTWKLFDLGSVSVERYGFPYLTVYRPDLHRVLVDAVQREKPGAIHLNARCTGLEHSDRGVRLQLENGEQIEGDALVGADGVHSRIREALFGEDKPRFTGIIAWRGNIPMDRLPRHMARLVATNWVGPGGHVVHYPVRHGELMNFVGAVERSDWQVESWTARGTADECADDFRNWHDDVHQMIRHAPALYKWALLGRAPMEQWSLGRVTLLGDACHPTLPFLAQGAVMAIEDGFMLARALSSFDDPATAFVRYENARRERARKMVMGSAENAKRFHNPKLAEQAGAQEYVDREWSEERINQRYEWLFTYDATTVEI